MKHVFFLSLLFAACLNASGQRTNRLDSTGNAGIGILAPTEKLEIYSNTLSNIKLTNFSDILGSVGALKFNMAGTDVGRLEVERTVASGRRSAMKFFVRGDSLSEVMRIIENGNMGIGETLPNARLHVSGKQNSVSARFSQSGIPSTDGFFSILNGTNSPTVYFPTLLGRSYAPGRSLGLYIIGEPEDVTPPASDAAFGAIILNGRTKSAGRLVYNNVLTVNNGDSNLLMIKANGNVGIGTIAPGPYKLAVEGTIGARKIKVTQVTPWADFVFDSDYKLPSLQEVEDFISINKHLRDIPSAAEVTKDGIDLGEINQKLLQKIEEQMLYIIEMNKKINTLTNEMKDLKEKVSAK
ncbi:hypothetical protein [Chitinophaga sp. RAB17]|uniref:hypothetical protein n=1 Tax=Chitinophaga sp. RAB17 TaxID=3233049 RepID=UPI003F8E04D0